jgi:hypothetical protein
MTLPRSVGSHRRICLRTTYTQEQRPGCHHSEEAPLFMLIFSSYTCRISRDLKERAYDFGDLDGVGGGDFPVGGA